MSTSYSKDRGLTWNESPLPKPEGWDGMTDPALAFDSRGNAFIVVEPIRFTSLPPPEDLQGMGMYVYKSSNGGRSWIGPTILHANDKNDDKQWIACDNNSDSSYFGNIYVVWGAYFPLRFARSIDHGDTWKGVGSNPSGSEIHSYTFSPEISVGDDGTVHIVWHIPGSSTIQYIRSTNGGESFESVIDAASGIVDIDSRLPPDTGESFAHFPKAEFRVMTLATGCALPDNRFVVAWADMREGLSRIYYRVAEKGGSIWKGSNSGEPLIPWFHADKDLHHFHPQLISTWSGGTSPRDLWPPTDNDTSLGTVVGCAFYEFGPKDGKYLIDTRIAASYSLSDGFGYIHTITDKPWDPAVNAPWSHGNRNETFIGEYFGFDASYDKFFVVWTDTRTGVQELFFDEVSTKVLDILTYVIPWPPSLEDLKNWTDHTKDGGGIILIGDKIIKVFPHEPKADILNALAALDAIEQINHPASAKMALGITEAIGQIVKDWSRKFDQR